jgi:hypothetical protein
VTRRRKGKPSGVQQSLRRNLLGPTRARVIREKSDRLRQHQLLMTYETHFANKAPQSHSPRFSNFRYAQVFEILNLASMAFWLSENANRSKTLAMLFRLTIADTPVRDRWNNFKTAPVLEDHWSKALPGYSVRTLSKIHPQAPYPRSLHQRKTIVCGSKNSVLIQIWGYPFKLSLHQGKKQEKFPC